MGNSNGSSDSRSRKLDWKVFAFGAVVALVAAGFVAAGIFLDASYAGIAVIVVAVAFGAAMVGVLVLLSKLAETVQEATRAVQQGTDETITLLSNVNETVTGVNTQLARVDTIVASVQQISYRAEGIAGVLQAAVANPLIKGIAFVTGTRAAAKAARKVT
jgi:uncharacterized protein YoxC